MREFHLYSAPITLSREDLEKMATSWSDLRELTLDTLPEGIALESLSIFAKKYRKLEFLYVQIKPVESDWVWPPSDQSSVYVSSLQQNLKYIDLMYSIFPPGAEKSVARFLSYLFPKAEISDDDDYPSSKGEQDPAHLAVVDKIKEYKKQFDEIAEIPRMNAELVNQQSLRRIDASYGADDVAPYTVQHYPGQTYVV